jgi:hypothetical protein
MTKLPVSIEKEQAGFGQNGTIFRAITGRLHIIQDLSKNLTDNDSHRHIHYSITCCTYWSINQLD